jgi:hypothetical protein
MPPIGVEPPARGRSGLAWRVVAVVWSPYTLFGGLWWDSRFPWFGVLLASVVIGSVPEAVFLWTDRGQQAFYEYQLRGLASVREKLTPDQVEAVERSLGANLDSVWRDRLVPNALSLAAPPVVFAVFFYAVLLAWGPGDTRFGTVFAVLAHSNVVLAARQLFAAALAFLGAPFGQIDTSLAAAVPISRELPIASRLDVFRLWWIVVVSMGLAPLYKVRTRTIACSLAGFYFVWALASNLGIDWVTIGRALHGLR